MPLVFRSSPYKLRRNKTMLSCIADRSPDKDVTRERTIGRFHSNRCGRCDRSNSEGRCRSTFQWVSETSREVSFTSKTDCPCQSLVFTRLRQLVCVYYAGAAIEFSAYLMYESEIRGDKIYFLCYTIQSVY